MQEKHKSYLICKFIVKTEYAFLLSQCKSSSLILQAPSAVPCATCTARTDTWRTQTAAPPASARPRHVSYLSSVCPSICTYTCLHVFLSVCFSVYLPVCLSVCMTVFLIDPPFVHLYIILSVHLSVCLSLCLFVCLSIPPFVYLLNICLSVSLYVYLPVCLSVCLFVCLSVFLSLCLPVCLFVCLPALPASVRPHYVRCVSAWSFYHSFSDLLTVKCLSVCLSVGVGCRTCNCKTPPRE